ncbi:MAG: hypothetical protein CME65_09305 [Halobacteriovoraceae bacterium]|nr:hypothetical protein [Halobacteriovoraceae bacterium]
MSLGKNLLFLDFFGFILEISCDHDETLAKIREDFHFFICETTKSNFIVECKKADSLDLPENIRAKSQSQNSITYINQDVKFQDYYGKAWTETYSYKVYIRYIDFEILHEILYLVILSYSGKNMDKRGFHKIHACAISRDRRNLVFMMPSKGGKTTLFMDLLSDEQTSIISDDTPVVNRFGNLHAFPLRIGSESRNTLFNSFPYISEKSIYEFDRQYFSKKYLLGLKHLKNKVFVSSGPTLFLIGYRSTRKTPKIFKLNRWQFLKELFHHMVVGVGLPMVIEHFFRLGWKDSFVNLKIFISRLVAAVIITFRHDSYLIEMSQSRTENLKAVRELLDEK